MAPDGTPPADRSNSPQPRGDGGRNRRRGGRGGRGGERSRGQAAPQGGAPGATPQGGAAGTPQGQANPPRQPGEGRPSRPGTPQRPAQPGQSAQGRREGTREGREGREGTREGNREVRDDRGRQQGRRGPEGGNRQAGRGQENRPAQPQGRGGAGADHRSRRREVEEEAPNLLEWAIEHAGYTFWIAHADIQPAAMAQRAVRSYVVDVHAGEDAVNPRLWAVIAPFLELEVAAPDMQSGRKLLEERIRQCATEQALPPVSAYLEAVPPVEQAVSSPVQAALDTAIPLELDTPWEDIEVMNEGRKGAPLRLAQG